MDESFFDKIYKNKTQHTPDVLSCLANLSNDEVFTPPDVVNQMLDLLPQDLFQNPNTTFLDPACKTGVFLREIAKRLLVGLEDKIPNLQERIDHIFHKQLYGIAITELTSLLSRRSLYCSKYPNGPYSITKFDNPEGNIRFRRINHTWGKNEKCVFCGASKEQWDRGKNLETYAYEWIHTNNPEEIFKMKFDVIISNPPYQLSDGGNGTSAKPIYQLFVKSAKKLNPRYISMIIPSRWFAGGKGLDDFRSDMLSDKSIKKLVDFENFKDVFPGVDLAGGACYFLRDKLYDGNCEVVNFTPELITTKTRPLDHYDTFIRSNIAVDIVDKIIAGKSHFISERVYSRKPFGIQTNYIPKDSGTPCYFTQKIGKKFVSNKDVIDSNHIIDKWKLLVPKTPIAGQTDFSKSVGFYYEGNTRIAKPGEICTESWLVLGAFDTEEEIKSYKSYVFTKLFRFLLLQAVVSQNTSKKNFCFIPDFAKYTIEFTDEMLCKIWNITEKEWQYIDSRIHNYDGGDN